MIWNLLIIIWISHLFEYSFQLVLQWAFFTNNSSNTIDVVTYINISQLNSSSITVICYHNHWIKTNGFGFSKTTTVKLPSCLVPSFITSLCSDWNCLYVHFTSVVFMVSGNNLPNKQLLSLLMLPPDNYMNWKRYVIHIGMKLIQQQRTHHHKI